MAEAFGRDGFLEREIRYLIHLHGIGGVIETGAWRGYTTRAFAGMVERVITIEVDPVMWEATKQTCADLRNVIIVKGNSGEFLKDFGIPAQVALYYLDAHWGHEWPLFDELEAIAAMGRPCVIVIHDCQVPGKDFGFDSYGGRALTFELVKPYLDKLPFKWTHRFNEEAQGHRRGVLFIEPC